MSTGAPGRRPSLAAPAGQPGHPPAVPDRPAGPVTLRVVTYNIWGTGMPYRYWRERGVLRGAVAGTQAVDEADEEAVWRRRAALLTEALAGADADLVALQEVAVDRSSGISRAEELARRLRVDHGVGYEVATSGDGPGAGLAVLSRAPIRGRRLFPLPGAGGFGGRPTVLEVCTADVTVWVVHLPVGPDEVKERCLAGLQAAATAATADVPLLLCGDLNCPADSDMMRRLRDDAVLIDAWLAGGGAMDARTAPVPEPTWRLDYVLCRNVDEVRAVREPALLGTVPDGSGQFASDHLGAAVSLCLAAPRRRL